MIKITTSSGKVHEGSLYAVDPITRTVVLKENDVFTLINSNSISAINGDLPTTGVAVEHQEPSAHEIRTSEETALRNREKSLENLNRNVPGNVQALFDKFSLLYPNCRWEHNHMIVLDDYIIEAPTYSEVKVLPGREGSSGRDRIAKILQGERQRLKMT